MSGEFLVILWGEVKHTAKYPPASSTTERYQVLLNYSAEVEKPGTQTQNFSLPIGVLFISPEMCPKEKAKAVFEVSIKKIP